MLTGNVMTLPTAHPYIYHTRSSFVPMMLPFLTTLRAIRHRLTRLRALLRQLNNPQSLSTLLRLDRHLRLALNRLRHILVVILITTLLTLPLPIMLPHRAVLCRTEVPMKVMRLNTELGICDFDSAVEVVDLRVLSRLEERTCTSPDAVFRHLVQRHRADDGRAHGDEEVGLRGVVLQVHNECVIGLAALLQCARRRPNTLRDAKQQQRLINRVRSKTEQHTVTRARVRVGSQPRRVVRVVVVVEIRNLSKRLLIDQFLQCAEVRVIPPILENRQDLPRLLRHLNQMIRLRHSRRERLLHNTVLSRLECFLRKLGVAGHCGADADEVDVLVGEEVVGGAVVLGVGVVDCAVVAGLGVFGGFFALEEGVDFEVGVRRDVGEVEAFGGEAVAHEADADGCHGCGREGVDEEEVVVDARLADSQVRMIR